MARSGSSSMIIGPPLHDLHARLGARFAEPDDGPPVRHYGEVAAEYGAVRERAGVIDRADRGVLEATGRDRAAFLHAMLTTDIKGLVPGQGRRAALLDVHGKIVSLMVVHALADRLLLAMDRALVAPTAAALDKYLFSERVELEDVTPAHACLVVAGPGARAAVEKLAEQPLPDLTPFHHAPVTIDGLDVRVARVEEVGEDGYELWASPDGAGRLLERLVGSGVQPVGGEAWEVLRVEAGAPRYGVDVDAGTLLLEAPLDDAYVLDKGCYLGQEVVARITYRGHVNRKLVGFRFADARKPARGAPVRVADKDVGRITSSVVSPATGAVIALGFLRREHWTPGTAVEVTGPDGVLAAEVASLPFYRRSG
jgi:folate-binding protein YgfZ